MKFAFVTCVKIGLSCIEEIYNIGNSLELIITLDDKYAPDKSGRVFLDDFCKEKNVELLKIRSINEDICKEKILAHKIDWLFIIGWSQIAKPEILKIPLKGVIGAHPTLLPSGRGRASIPWAILKSLKSTGVTFFKMDENVDTGAIIDQQIIPIDKDEDASSLYKKVVLTHKRLIKKIIKNLLESKITLKEQNSLNSSYWPGRIPEDGEIDLSGSVFDAEILIRATTRPYPGAYYIKNSKKFIVWKAKIIKNNLKNIKKDKILHFKDGSLLIKDMQCENLYS